MSDQITETTEATPTHVAIPIGNFRALMEHLGQVPGNFSYGALKQLENPVGVNLTPQE